MTKILFFINTLSSGGAEHQLSILANILADRGYEVRIATFGDEDDYYPLDSNIFRIRLNRFSNKILRLTQIWLFFFRLKVDWVITFGARESFFATPGLLFNRHVKLIAGERNVTMPNQPLSEFICHKYLLRRASYIVPNSHTQGKYIENTFPKLASKVSVITNYTDLSKYCPKDYSREPNRIVIVARYNHQKNWYRFAEAVYKLKGIIGSTFVIDCYGNRDLKIKALSEYYQGLIALIDKFDIGDVLRLHNSIKNVAEEMNMAEAVCLPSLHEGFSNAISEAICCGRPVLCSDVADNGVMVHDGVNGILFNPLDVDDIVRALKSFIDTPPFERERMGRESRIIAEQLFNKDVFVDSYISLIES